jgi:NAD(P)-dependent dehydrogenase (short-subunit alcohol dehydrogenase family)
MGDPMNLYAHLFTNPAGPGDMRPTALQIIEDHNLIGAWNDRTVLITGGSSGIGLETARAMHATGADVFITARTASKGDEAVSEIRRSSVGTGRLEVIEMELSSLASVRQAASSFLQRSSSLNVLINNAGVMGVPHTLTEDGHESHLV